jgi:4-hydroxy-tetrahydrodipicolinate reductase
MGFDMIKILLNGCNGRMGQAVAAAVENIEDMRIVAGVDVFIEKKNSFPVFADPMEFRGQCDVVIDFSSAASTHQLLIFCKSKKLPLVLATTGHSEEQLEEIRLASEETAIFKTANMSLGINLITELAKQAAKLLGSTYDIEIIERHHNQKLDAPSGTALQIADEIKKVLPFEAEYAYDRHSVRRKREKKEIGMHCIRGGTIVGDHDILFAGTDETIQISHSALSRGVFVNGAVKAASFLCGREPGLYSMSDMLAEIL